MTNNNFYFHLTQLEYWQKHRTNPFLSARTTEECVLYVVDTVWTADIGKYAIQKQR